MPGQEKATIDDPGKHLQMKQGAYASASPKGCQPCFHILSEGPCRIKRTPPCGLRKDQLALYLQSKDSRVKRVVSPEAQHNNNKPQDTGLAATVSRSTQESCQLTNDPNRKEEGR